MEDEGSEKMRANNGGPEKADYLMRCCEEGNIEATYYYSSIWTAINMRYNGLGDNRLQAWDPICLSRKGKGRSRRLGVESVLGGHEEAEGGEAGSHRLAQCCR